MAQDKTEATWINLTPDALAPEQKEAFDMFIEAKHQFESTFAPMPGHVIRFSYKGADFDKIGMCEIAAPKSRDAVKQNLQAWLAARRAAGSRT